MLPHFGLETFEKEYPSALSGGMRQRAALLRTWLMGRSTLLLDEPFGALDALTRKELQNWLLGVWQEFGRTVMFITHDLGIAAQICDRVAVMYSGRIVEIGTTMDLFDKPLHPYTRGLLKAVPKLGEKETLQGISGMIPDLAHPPQGCRFHPRCDHRLTVCQTRKPAYKGSLEDYAVACHLFNAKDLPL